MDGKGLSLCDMQAKIFVSSLEYTECSSAVFIRRYMLSEFAKRMDRCGSLYESFTEDDVLAEIEAEYGKTNYGREKYSYDELYWMGYIYRYWCYAYEIESKRAYREILPKDLRALYYPYHTLDINNAIGRILEAKGKTGEKDLTKKGIEIVKRIWRERGIDIQ